MEWTDGPPDTWDRMAEWLRGLSCGLPQRPRGIVVISAHWEAGGPVVTANPAPSLVFDYYGFPPHTYELRYPVPGDPALADAVVRLLGDDGFSARTDPERGLDHGVFVPFMLIYPEADVPIVQVSMDPGMDPGLHLRMGRALAPLRRDNVLIVGSGLSSHNLPLMRGNTELDGSAEFNRWLVEACGLPPDRRRRALAGWSEAVPSARHVHPREDHLIPLMVAAGAAGDDAGNCVFHDRVLGADAVGIRFGGAAAGAGASRS